MAAESGVPPDVLRELAAIVRTPGEDGLERLSRLAARVAGADSAEIRLWGGDDAADAPDGLPADQDRGSGGGSPDGVRGDEDRGSRSGPLDRLAVPLVGGDGREAGRLWLFGLSGGADLGGRLDLLESFADVVGAALAQQSLVARLQEAERLHEAFFGVVSHELRTPITTIYGGTHVLRRSDGRLSHDAREQLLEDVTDEAERLYRLVEDLLVLSRAENGGQEVSAEPILLQHVLPRVIESERRRWPRSRLHLDAAPSLPPAAGELVLVEQVLRNLTSNALKYAGDAGPVEVAVRGSDGWIEVSVADNGPGVEESMRERVFELFFRAPDAPAKAQGAGIGLYVCRRLVRSMGGELWVRSRQPRGAEFGFRLPEYVVELIDDGPEDAAASADVAASRC